jgi:hypothetical protein
MKRSKASRRPIKPYQNHLQNGQIFNGLYPIASPSRGDITIFNAITANVWMAWGFWEARRKRRFISKRRKIIAGLSKSLF